MPNSPRKCVQVLNHIKSSFLKSPRKRLIMEEGQNGKKTRKSKDGTRICKQLKELKRKSTEEHVKLVCRLKKKYNSLRKAAQSFGMRYATLLYLCALTKYEKKQAARIEACQDFYCQSQVTVELPHTKYAGNKYLNRSLASAYQEYQKTAENPFSFSKFVKVRPKNVKCVRNTPKRQCLVCWNI